MSASKVVKNTEEKRVGTSGDFVRTMTHVVRNVEIHRRVAMELFMVWSWRVVQRTGILLGTMELEGG